MKKIIILLLSAVFITSLVACGTTKNPDDNTLRVGMDLKFPPFSYLDDSGVAAGLEPLIAEAFGEYLGRPVEIVNTDFSMLIPALETGDVDILIADMSETEERAQKADFSDCYRYTYTLALVNREFATANHITNEMSEDDFFAIEGAKFVGLSGTKGVYYPQSFGVDIAEVTEIGTGLYEISKGMSDVLIASNEIHGFHAADPNNTIVYEGLTDRVGSAFAVKKGNETLLSEANAFVETMYQDGGFYDSIREEWNPIVREFLQNSDLGLDYIINPPIESRK